MATKTLKINLPDSVVLLTVDDADGRFDTEDILRIDYSNILGELLTFPVVMNRVAMLKAQAESRVREVEFESRIYAARLSESLRVSLSKIEIRAGGIKKLVAPVKDVVDNSVVNDDGYQGKMREVFKAKKNLDYIEGLYWSVKSKDDKLKALASFIPKEFDAEIVQGVMNGIMIKGSKKPFNTGRS